MLRLLADACVPAPLVAALRLAGHDVEYVAEGPPGVPDVDVLAAAAAHGRLVLTEDHDFGALAVRDEQPCRGVVLMELHGLSAETRERRVLSVLLAAEAQLEGAFTIIEPSRVRTRPLRAA